MSEVKDRARDLIDALKAERDELRVQLHLASNEVRDRIDEEWDSIEHKWSQIKAKAGRLNRDVVTITSAVEDDLEDITDNVAENSKAALKEIRDGYERIRNLIKS